MEEEAVGSLGEMVTEGYALVVGPKDDVHGVVLALVVAAADSALSAVSVLVVEHHLVVAVAYLAVLAIEGCPDGVYPHAVHTTQLQGSAPVIMHTARHAQRRLKQAVVNIYSQTAGLNNNFPVVGHGIGHAIDLDGVASIGRRQFLRHGKQWHKHPHKDGKEWFPHRSEYVCLINDYLGY